MSSRITFIVPEQFIAVTNQFAAAIGLSIEDLHTYKSALYKDLLNNLYAVSSAPYSQEIIDKLTGTINRPDWDINEEIDLTTVASVQANLLIYTYENLPLVINVNRITAVIEEDGHKVIEKLKLSKVNLGDI